MKENNTTKSYILIISSMLIFGTIGVFRRYIPLSSGMLAFIRGVVGSLFLLGFVKINGIKMGKDIDKKSLILTIISGGFIGINWILLFEAFNYTTVATATLCYYMQPTIVIFLSQLILKEKLVVKKVICAIISIIGMLFVAGVIDAGNAPSIADLRGVFLGLGAAAFYSAVVMLNKMIHIENAYTKTIIQLSSAAIILVPYLIATGEFTSLVSSEEINVFVIVMILIVGIIHTGIAYAMYFGSMNNLKSQSIAIMSYIDPVFALILSAAFLHEKISIWGIIGAVLILGSALISEIEKI